MAALYMYIVAAVAALAVVRADIQLEDPVKLETDVKKAQEALKPVKELIIEAQELLQDANHARNAAEEMARNTTDTNTQLKEERKNILTLATQLYTLKIIAEKYQNDLDFAVGQRDMAHKLRLQFGHRT